MSLPAIIITRGCDLHQAILIELTAEEITALGSEPACCQVIAYRRAGSDVLLNHSVLLTVVLGSLSGVLDIAAADTLDMPPGNWSMAYVLCVGGTRRLIATGSLEVSFLTVPAPIP